MLHRADVEIARGRAGRKRIGIRGGPEQRPRTRRGIQGEVARARVRERTRTERHGANVRPVPDDAARRVVVAPAVHQIATAGNPRRRREIAVARIAFGVAIHQQPFIPQAVFFEPMPPVPIGSTVEDQRRGRKFNPVGGRPRVVIGETIDNDRARPRGGQPRCRVAVGFTPVRIHTDQDLRGVPRGATFQERRGRRRGGRHARKVAADEHHGRAVGLRTGLVVPVECDVVEGAKRIDPERRRGDRAQPPNRLRIRVGHRAGRAIPDHGGEMVETGAPRRNVRGGAQDRVGPGFAIRRVPVDDHGAQLPRTRQRAPNLQRHACPCRQAGAAVHRDTRCAVPHRDFVPARRHTPGAALHVHDVANDIRPEGRRRARDGGRARRHAVGHGVLGRILRGPVRPGRAGFKRPAIRIRTRRANLPDHRSREGHLLLGIYSHGQEAIELLVGRRFHKRNERPERGKDPRDIAIANPAPPVGLRPVDHFPGWITAGVERRPVLRVVLRLQILHLKVNPQDAV